MNGDKVQELIECSNKTPITYDKYISHLTCGEVRLLVDEIIGLRKQIKELIQWNGQ